MQSSVSITSTHGELRRRLADLIGSDPERYSEDLGSERHRCLLASEVDKLCEAFDMRLEGDPRQQQLDAVMIRLGRDHRTAVRMGDSSDLVAVIEALEGDVDDPGGDGRGE